MKRTKNGSYRTFEKILLLHHV